MPVPRRAEHARAACLDDSDAAALRGADELPAEQHPPHLLQFLEADDATPRQLAPRPDDVWASMAHPDAAHRAGRRGYAWRPGAQRGVGTGNNIHLGQAGMRLAKALCFACAEPGCCALVDFLAATRRNGDEGNTSFVAGVGCASELCTRNFHRSRFEQTQLRMAAQLRSGTRLLVRRPATLSPDHVWLVSTAGTEQAAAAACAAVSPPPSAAQTRPRRPSRRSAAASPPGLDDRLDECCPPRR